MATPIKFERTREPAAQPGAVPSFTQCHYTVRELAELWKLSDDKIRELFENEPGVIVIGEQWSGRKRRYVTLRIPEHVAERVYRRLVRV